MATNTTINQTALPDWLTQYYQNVLGKAQGVAAQPYQTYGAPRIAGFAPEQQQAFTQVQQNQGNWQPALDAATTSARAGTAGWTDPGVAESYMNPYQDEVVADIGTLAGRNLSENLLPQVNRTFVGSGTFGGSRSAEFTARAVRDANESALREQNQAMQAGYTNGAQTFGADAARDIQAASVQAGIGSTQQKLAGTDAAALEAVGAQRQGLAQNSADLAYQDFEHQRDYPTTQLQTLVGIGGTPTASGTGTSTTTTPSPNNTAQTIGGIAAGIGTIGKIFGAARGGRVRRPRGIGAMA